MAYISPLAAFASTVQSQTYELHELGRVSSLVAVTNFYYYENAAGDANFMTTRLLEDSFALVLREYPLLAGTLRESRLGRYTVAVDRDSLNLPEFKVTECDTDFAQLKASQYAPSALPEGAATVGSYIIHSRKKSAKLARVHIMRCKDNSGVAMFVAISHALVDATSLGQVMRRWAEHYKHLAGNGAASTTPGAPLAFGCRLMDGYIQQAAPPAGAFIRHRFIPGGPKSKLTNMLSLATQMKLHRRRRAETRDMSSHFYFVAKDTMNAMRCQIRESVPEDQSVSNNDVLTALVSVAVAHSLPGAARGDAPAGALQRAKAAVAKTLGLPPPESFVHMGTADVRPRLRIPAAADYCGSAVLAYTAHTPVAVLRGPVTSAMAQAATAARRGTDSVDRGYIHAYAEELAAAPDACLRPFIYGSKRPMYMPVTNHARAGHYDADFGWGVPTWVNALEEAMCATCFVYPAHPSRNGAVVHLMLPRDIHDRMRQLPLWKEKVEFIR